MQPERLRQLRQRRLHHVASVHRGRCLGDFASLKNVCHPGSATGASDQGITSSQIKVGVLTDVGFTKDPTLINAATVFTDWCNAAGGIDGRKLVPDIHDTGMLNVVQAVTAACGTDFSLVGGSAALDGLAVKQRVSCLLPDFDAQVVMPQNSRWTPPSSRC